jgi:hypothetical protein
MSACEYALEVAEEQAKIQLKQPLFDLISTISDEIIDTAEEYEPKDTD